MVRAQGRFIRKAAEDRAKFLKGHGYRTKVVLRQDGFYAVEAGSTEKTGGEFDSLLRSVSEWWLNMDGIGR